MLLRLDTHCMCHMVPATILRPNSGLSSDFHYRCAKFFLPHVSSLPKNILCPDTFFGTKFPMLLASFIDDCPCYLCRKHHHVCILHAPIKTIVNIIQSGWTTHISIFFTIGEARIPRQYLQTSK